MHTEIFDDSPTGAALSIYRAAVARLPKHISGGGAAVGLQMNFGMHICSRLGSSSSSSSNVTVIVMWFDMRERALCQETSSAEFSEDGFLGARVLP